MFTPDNLKLNMVVQIKGARVGYHGGGKSWSRMVCLGVSLKTTNAFSNVDFIVLADTSLGSGYKEFAILPDPCNKVADKLRKALKLQGSVYGQLTRRKASSSRKRILSDSEDSEDESRRMSNSDEIVID